MPTLTVAGAQLANMPSIASIAFGAGGCGTLFGTTALVPGELTFNLTSGLPETPGGGTADLVVCYSVSSGAAWTEQASAGLAVLTANETSLSGLSPSVWGVNYAATFNVSGAVDLGYTRLAFSTTTTGCLVSAARNGAATFSGGNPVTLDEVILQPGLYRVCYSVNGGASWKPQQWLTVSVIRAGAGAITAVHPAAIGLGTTPNMTFAGAVASQSTRIGFGVGGCGAVVAVMAYGSTGPVAPPAGMLTASHDTICYSTDDGVSFVAQTGASLTVVPATPSSIGGLWPTVIGAGATEVSLSLANAPPVVAGARLAFAAPAACAAGPRVGLTNYTTDAGLTIGSAVAAAGVYDVCFSVDGGAVWVDQSSLSVTAVLAGAGDVLSLTPPAVGVATTPTVSVTINGAIAMTATAFVGWSLDPGCATGTVEGAVPIAAAGLNVVAVGSGGLTAPGNHTVCFSLGGSGPSAAWVVQSGLVTSAVAAHPLSIVDIQPRLVSSDVAPTFTVLAGAVSTPTSRLSFAPVGACGIPTQRWGDTSLADAYPSVAPLELVSSLNTGASYMEMAACFSTDGGATWVEQTTVTIEVAAECSTLTSCGACTGNRFCAFCLATGTCRQGSSVPGCAPMDTVAPNGTCPAVVAYGPDRGDVSGGTAVTVGVDYLAHNATNATTTAMACTWSVGSDLFVTPWVASGAAGSSGTNGVCTSPPQVRGGGGGTGGGGVAWRVATLLFLGCGG